LRTWELEEEEFNRTGQREAEFSQKAYAAHRRNPKSRKSKEEVAELRKKHNVTCVRRQVTGKVKKDKTDYERKNKSDVKSGGTYMAGHTPTPDLWLCDYGADRHYSGRLEWFYEYEKFSTPKSVAIADGEDMMVQGVGKVRVKAFIRKEWKIIELHDVESSSMYLSVLIFSLKMYCSEKDSKYGRAGTTTLSSTKTEFRMLRQDFWTDCKTLSSSLFRRVPWLV